MSDVNSIVTQIRGTLTGDKLSAYLQALKDLKQGQAKFSSGDWEGCLTHSMRAHDLLS